MHILQTLVTALVGIFLTTAGESLLAASTNNKEEEDAACCAAILLEEGGGSLAPDGKYLPPPECRRYGVSCARLGFRASDSYTALTTSSSDEAALLFLEEQAALREKPGCDPDEWVDRCPSDSTMMLAPTRLGCLSAGCVALIESDVDGEGLDDRSLLRAVTAQEVARLGPSRSFRKHSWAMRRSFLKEQRHLAAELKMKLQYARHIDVEGVRSIAELATRKGFRGSMIDRAKVVVAEHDAQRNAELEISLMEREIEKARQEISSLQKVAEEQDISARVKARKHELELQPFLRERDSARAQATSAAEAVSTLEKELSTRASDALAVQRGLETELAGLKRTLLSQHAEAIDEAERFNTTTRILRHRVNGLEHMIMLLSSVNAEVEESFLSTTAVRRAEMNVTLQCVAEAETRARAFQSKAEEESRMADLAYSSLQAELQDAIESRDEADRRTAVIAEQIAMLEEEILAEEERDKNERLEMMEALERAHHGLEDSQAEGDSLAVVIALRRQKASSEANQFAAAVSEAHATISNLTDTMNLLRASTKEMELDLVSATKACELELGALTATVNASARETEGIVAAGRPVTESMPLGETMPSDDHEVEA